MRAEIKTAAARAVEELGAGSQPVRVVYPQYGGLLESSASVMVIAKRARSDGRGQDSRSTVFDVRLLRRGGRWSVTDARPARGADDVARPPDAAASAVIANPRLELPDPAVGDLRAGVVDPLVVAILDRLSTDFRMRVSVLRTGHPHNVYGTSGLSNHTRGRAVDIWAIDGIPVVSMPPDDPRLLRFISAARDLGSDEIGAPADPDGPGGIHFANDLHRDHVHIGFDPTISGR